MVKYNPEKLNAVFHALADPTRRAILRTLYEKKFCTISELAEPFSMSFAAASKHVKVLENASLLSRKIVGRKHICTFSPNSLAEAEQWISYYKEFWTTRLDALEMLLEQQGDANE